MRITNVEASALRMPTRPYRWRDGAPEQRQEALTELLYLRLRTDTDIVGECIWPHGKVLAESSPADIVFGYIDRILSPVLVGADPLRREKWWQKLWATDRYAQMPPYVLGVMDVALWDIAGRAFGVPLWKLLGGFRDRIPVYASTFTLEDVGAYRRHARELVDRGYKAIKLHVWGRVEDDLIACEAVREEVGEQVVLMLDAAGAYSREAALWAGRRLERLGFYWFEEPIPDYDLEGLRTLAQALDIPLLVAESTPGSLYGVGNVLRVGAADMIHADWYQKGGITGLVKIAHLCEAAGVKCQIHAGGPENLHVACAIRNADYHEQIVPEETFHLLTKAPLALPDDRGCVSPSGVPGNGLDVDYDKVEEYKYAGISSGG